MKPVSDDLFRLIQLLSMAEKRYFKVNALGRMKSKDYVELFDAIRLQKIYDEEAIKKKFKGKKFVKQLPSIKNYLYKNILRSLRSYHSRTTIEQQLNNFLSEASVLYEKGMDDKSLQHLKKAKKVAYKYYEQKRLLQIVDLQIKVLQSMQNFNQLEKTVASLLLEEKNLNEILKTENHRSQLKNQLMILVRRYGAPKSTKESDAYDRVVQQVQLIDKRTVSTPAKLIYFDIFSTYYFFAHRDYAKALEYLQKKLVLFSSTNFKYAAIELYFNTLHNVIMIHQTVGDIKKAMKQLASFHEELLQWKERIPYRLFLKLEYQVYRLRAGQYSAAGDFEDAIKSMNKFDEKVFQKLELINAIGTNDVLVFYYEKAHLYFIAGDFSNCLKYINSFFNRASFSLDSTIFQAISLLYLIAHYELGNTEFIENRIRSHFYFLKKKDELFEYERMLLKFFREVIKFGLKADITSCFVKLKQNIQLIQGNPTKTVLLNYFDIYSWIESKIEDRAFAEVIREKAKRIVGS
ncbi:MAG: hypothetical protein IT235_08120 [Bacteroidia bacterium]|nr:hypothetical protein [Bacteroidia bacterium]